MEDIGKGGRALEKEGLVSACEAGLQSGESRLDGFGERGNDFGIHVGFSVLDELVGSFASNSGLLHKMATRSTPNPEGVASSSPRVLSHQVNHSVG